MPVSTAAEPNGTPKLRGRRRLSVVRPARPEKLIDFGHKRTWHAVADDAEMADARNPDLQLPIRLRALARATANRIGHAEFGHGQLMRELEIVNTVTGEVRPATKQDISRAIRSCVKKEWLEPESSTRCLVLSWHKVQRGVRGTTCSIHCPNPKR